MGNPIRKIGMTKYYVKINVDGECWFRHNLPHRENGLAVILIDGIMEYWLNGDQYKQDEYDKILRENL